MRWALPSLQKTWWSLMSAGETCCPSSQGQGLRAFLPRSKAVEANSSHVRAHYDHSGERKHWGKKSLPHLGEARERLRSSHGSCGCHCPICSCFRLVSGCQESAQSLYFRKMSLGRSHAPLPFQEENEDIRGSQMTKENCLRRAFRKNVKTLYKLLSTGFCLLS